MKMKTNARQSKSGLSLTYSIIVYLNELSTINMRERGRYYIAIDYHFTNPNNIKKLANLDNTIGPFDIQYNNQTINIQKTIELKLELDQDNLFFKKIYCEYLNKQKFYYIRFSLLKAIPENSFQYQEQLEKIQCVAEYSYRVCTQEKNRNFMEYYQVKFGGGHVADIDGLIVCLSTEVHNMENNKRCQNIDMQILCKQQRYGSHNVHQKLVSSSDYIYNISVPCKQNNLLAMVHIPQQIQPTITPVNNFIIKTIMLSQQQFSLYLFQFEKTRKQPQELQIQLSHICLQNKQLYKRILFLLHKQKISLDTYLMQYKKQIANCYQQNNKIYKIQEKQSEEIDLRLKSNPTQSQIYRRNSYTMIESSIYQNQSVKQLMNLQDCIAPALIQSTELMNAVEEFYLCQNVLKTMKRQSKSNIYINRLRLVPHHSRHNIQKSPYIIYSHVKLKPKASEQNDETKEYPSRNLVVLAHGYEGSSSSMDKLYTMLKRLFPKGNKYLLLGSYSEEMNEDIDEMGKKVAKQIKSYLISKRSSLSNPHIIFLGHSMGGIILRACIQYLDSEIRQRLHTYISLGSPHLGYLYCHSRITSTGLSLLNNWLVPHSVSLRQMSNICTKSSKQFKNSYLYKLARLGSLKDFKNVVLFASIEDKYVPWNSARIQTEKNANERPSSLKRKHQLEMANMIFGEETTKIRQIHRFNVQFDPDSNNGVIDCMIGRIAHASFLFDEQYIEMAFQVCIPKQSSIHRDLFWTADKLLNKQKQIPKRERLVYVKSTQRMSTRFSQGNYQNRL